MDRKNEYVQAYWVNNNQRFNAAYEDYKIAIPGPLDGKHHVANYEDVKIAVPSPFDGKHQVANHAMQIESTNRDPNNLEEHGVRWYENQVIRNRVNITIKWLCVCLIVIYVMLIPIWVHLTMNSVPYYYVRYGNYTIPMKTKEYGIEFYVKSIEGFNKKYPEGTPARDKIEKTIIDVYIQNEHTSCWHELRWHSVNSDYPTPECDKLQSMGIPISDSP